MKYVEFEKIMSPPRMNRYKTACGGDTKKAMTLYRKNLKLSQELFTIISCFEIALRNGIDKHCVDTLGNDWLRAAAATGGIFDNPNCRVAQRAVSAAIQSLGFHYSHNKLVADLGFGFWRYLFNAHLYRATGQSLLTIFLGRPSSSIHIQYNHTYVFRQLAEINMIRNRIAHHEPICFQSRLAVKDTNYVRQNYNLILQLFQWMGINESELLYGLDHINSVCNEIDAL